MPKPIVRSGSHQKLKIQGGNSKIRIFAADLSSAQNGNRIDIKTETLGNEPNFLWSGAFRGNPKPKHREEYSVDVMLVSHPYNPANGKLTEVIRDVTITVTSSGGTSDPMTETIELTVVKSRKTKGSLKASGAKVVSAKKSSAVKRGTKRAGGGSTGKGSAKKA